MAQVTTVDVTTIIGSDTFPVNANDVYDLVETIAVQNIRSLKSSNRIEDAFYDYVVENGTVIEEAVTAMAEAQEFVKTGQPDLSPVDPKLFVKYFNNWEAKQFPTTVRRSDIRKIIANKGTGFDELVSQILATLTEGEGEYDMRKMAGAIAEITSYNDEDKAYRSFEAITGRKAKNAKGVLWALREAYNIVKATNNYGIVKPANMSEADYARLKQATPVEDIRIAISESLLNLIDVTELANVFNLEKEELFGKLVVLPYDYDVSGPEFACVYDRKALGRGTRLFEYSQDVIGKGLYTNHYLTTERCYFWNQLYKAIALDFTEAYQAMINEVSIATE